MSIKEFIKNSWLDIVFLVFILFLICMCWEKLYAVTYSFVDPNDITKGINVEYETKTLMREIVILSNLEAEIKKIESDISNLETGVISQIEGLKAQKERKELLLQNILKNLEIPSEVLNEK